MPGGRSSNSTLRSASASFFRGVVPAPQGWAVRVSKLAAPQARNIIDSDFAAEVEHDLMHTDPKHTTHHYILKGVPFALSFEQSVSLLKQAMGYVIWPLRSLKSRDRANHNIHFIALAELSCTIVQLEGRTHATRITS